MRDIIGHPQAVTYTPNRNMTMLSIACGYAESVKAQDVLTAVVALDNLSGYWDCTREFIDTFNSVLAFNRLNKIIVKSPLVELSKSDIIKQGFEMGCDFSRTWTCYEGRHVSCGVCPACTGRIKGFIDASRIDPLLYETNINWSKYGCVA
jgi:7-cyano-7-deazaguanine synthase